jgi:predicted RNase H-like nuclease (RuvC/YqgF family)
MARKKAMTQSDKNIKSIKELRKNLQIHKKDNKQERNKAQKRRKEEEKRRTEEEKRRAEEEKRRLEEKMEEEKRRLEEKMEEKARRMEHDKKMERMEIRLGKISQNIHSKTKRLEGEFDVVLYNGDTIGIVECKYTAHENDIHKLTDKKVVDFKALFPEYSNYKFLLGIASFSFNEVVEALAKSKGVAVIKQVGEVIIIDDIDLKIY